MKFFRKQHINPIAIIHRETRLIKEHYSFIECKSLNGGLYCYGRFQPTPDSLTYHYRIKYVPTKRPIVTLTNPTIEYNDDIHMYPKTIHSVYTIALIWFGCNIPLHDTNPWTHEWFVFMSCIVYGQMVASICST